MRHRRRHAGFTFVETALVAVFSMSLISAVGSAFATSNGLAKRSKVVLRAHEELRRNLGVIANTFRGAAASSLGGFGADLTSSAPSFKTVTGSDVYGSPILDASQSVQWQSSGNSVSGVAYPGQLTIVKGGVTTTLAKCVPAGGFKAILLGNTLKVQLTTYYTTSTGTTASVSGECSVSLRN